MAAGRVASFHLVTVGSGQAALALVRLGTDRIRLRRPGGPLFWRLLGTGRGADTGLGMDPRRTALFALWEDDAHLDRFAARSAVARRWERAEEAYTVRLRGVRGQGTWRGVDVLGALSPATAETGPVAVLTRATVRPRHWAAFVRTGHRVSAAVATAPGLLAVLGIGEAPLGRQATFSLWRSAADADGFSRGPEHAEAVRRTRTEGWYGEQLFARFQPYASTGTWDGRDPLAEVH